MDESLWETGITPTSAFEAHATKLVTQDQVNVDIEIKSTMLRVSTLELTAARGSGACESASAQGGSLTRGTCGRFPVGSRVSCAADKGTSRESVHQHGRENGGRVRVEQGRLEARVHRKRQVQGRQQAKRASIWEDRKAQTCQGGGNGPGGGCCTGGGSHFASGCP